MASHDPTVEQFLAGLPPDRRKTVDHVRDVLRRSMPAGYEEVVIKRMLVYQVPHERYPDTYNGQPLWYVALASEKAHLSLHLLSISGSPTMQQRLRDGFRHAGKRLAMGKGCVRFRSADDLALDVIGEIIATIPMDRWIAIAQSVRASRGASRSRKAGAHSAPTASARRPGSS